jgi:hypothetical protein
LTPGDGAVTIRSFFATFSAREALFEKRRIEVDRGIFDESSSIFRAECERLFVLGEGEMSEIAQIDHSLNGVGVVPIPCACSA